MVQPEYLCSSTFGRLPISTGGAQRVQRSEAENFCSLAAARSKMDWGANPAWQLHRSVSCSGPLRNLTCLDSQRVGARRRSGFETGRDRGGIEYRKSQSAAGGGLRMVLRGRLQPQMDQGPDAYRGLVAYRYAIDRVPPWHAIHC